MSDRIAECNGCGKTVKIVYGWSTRNRKFGLCCMPRKEKKRINAVSTRQKLKWELDNDLNEKIWSDRPHVCFECGILLRGPAKKLYFSHILSKGAHPELRFDPENIVRNGHRLVEFAGSVSSFIELRKAGREFHSYNECLLLADSVAYIHRLNGERFEATANFNDRRQSKFYMDDFEIMWASSLPDPNLKRLSI